jgi:WD40 repeat protein
MLKKLNRSARSTWCPDQRFGAWLATGTGAGQFDSNFETRSQLEIFDANIANPSPEMRQMGSITSQDAFHAIAWGSKGIQDSSLPCGLIAGGMSSGALSIWDAASIVRFDSASSKRDPVVVRLERAHQGQISDIAFHPNQQNLLASSAVDGTVLVWDIAQPSRPNSQPPCQLAPSQYRPSVNCVQWNKRVPSILAYGSEAGDTTICDLRKKDPIMILKKQPQQGQYSGNASNRVNAVAWHPTQAVQVACCYNNPTADVWDLRKNGQPILSLGGVHQGMQCCIACVAWGDECVCVYGCVCCINCIPLSF